MSSHFPPSPEPPKSPPALFGPPLHDVSRLDFSAPSTDFYSPPPPASSSPSFPPSSFAPSPTYPAASPSFTPSYATNYPGAAQPSPFAYHDHSHTHAHDHDHDDHHHAHDHDDDHEHDHSHSHDHDHHHAHDDHDHDHDHHDHDHFHSHDGHHDHEHSHSKSSSHLFQPAAGLGKDVHIFQPAVSGFSQRNSPVFAPATTTPYQRVGTPAASSFSSSSFTTNVGGYDNSYGSPSAGGNDILQPSNQGYVFTARKGGWATGDDRWGSLNYGLDNEPKMKASLAQYVKIILIDKDAKNLLMFIILSTVFTFVEIIYGASANSLGLISEAFHTIFDIVAMIISLIALVLSRHEPTNKFSYGYDRIEILSGFANGAFLLFVSFFLFVESVERILEPPELHSHGRVISIAFVGLIINAIGVVFFSQHSLHRTEFRNKARQENMKVIMLHLFTDMLSGIGVIISSWLAQSRGWHFADTLISILIGALIVHNAYPICAKTARVLLQTTPDSIYPAINKCLREASTLEGVLEYHSEHFWTQSPGVFVGSLCIKVRSNANEQSVLQQVTKLFAPYIKHLTVQIEKDNWNLQQFQQ